MTDTDAPVEHRQTIEMRWAPELPSLVFPDGDRVSVWRRSCSCGHRGVWLRTPEKVAPCPRAQEVR